ncbi:MAG: RNA recognition motif domain-containing protein [Candidatus Promineifilaceae bacterium]
MNIYVGNLSFQMSEQELNAAFAEFGAVTSAKIITDRDTGRSRGFGFVEMADDAEGMVAINQLNGSDLGGRALTVNVAKPREPRGGGGGGRGGYGGGGGRSGGGGGRGGYGGGGGRSGGGGGRGGYGGGGSRW